MARTAAKFSLILFTTGEYQNSLRSGATTNLSTKLEFVWDGIKQFY